MTKNDILSPKKFFEKLLRKSQYKGTVLDRDKFEQMWSQALLLRVLPSRN
jgi:hypothetical protein